MNEFVVKGETLQNLIVPPRFRDNVDLKEPIKGVMIIENTIVHFYSCELDNVFVTSVIESTVKKKKVFISNEFNKVFRLNPEQIYRVVIEEGTMAIYFYNGRLLYDLIGITL